MAIHPGYPDLTAHRRRSLTAIRSRAVSLRGAVGSFAFPLDSPELARQAVWYQEQCWELIHRIDAQFPECRLSDESLLRFRPASNAWLLGVLRDLEQWARENGVWRGGDDDV